MEGYCIEKELACELAEKELNPILQTPTCLTSRIFQINLINDLSSLSRLFSRKIYSSH